MSRDQNNFSPFAALSYQEQQDRWLEWRSRQLDFREAGVAEEAQKKPEDTEVPPVHLPHLQESAPVRHQNLDAVLSRHARAEKRLGAFRVTEAAAGAAPQIPSRTGTTQ